MRRASISNWNEGRPFSRHCFIIWLPTSKWRKLWIFLQHLVSWGTEQHFSIALDKSNHVGIRSSSLQGSKNNFDVVNFQLLPKKLEYSLARLVPFLLTKPLKYPTITPGRLGYTSFFPVFTSTLQIAFISAAVLQYFWNSASIYVTGRYWGSCSVYA